MTLSSPRQCHILGLGLVSLLVFLGFVTDMHKLGFGSKGASITRKSTAIDMGMNMEILMMGPRASQETTIVSTNASSSSPASSATVVPMVDATSDVPSCLIYVRIGKSGSSSLMKYFDDSLGEEQVFHDLCFMSSGMAGLREFSQKTSMESAKQVYQGHCGYGFDQYVCAQPRKQSAQKKHQKSSMQLKKLRYEQQTSCFYYTWLREPISRVISSFIYNHKKTMPVNLTKYKKCFQHDTYCPMEKGPNWHNSMTYHLGSPRDEIYHKNKPINVTREHLEKAKQRLEQDFVAFGLLEYSEESLKMLQPILKVISTKKKEKYQTQQKMASKIQPALAHKNTGIGSDSFKERVRIELGSDIEQANQLDMELYAFARQLFLDRLEKYGTTAEIPKNAKDWNTTVVQLHSCPKVPRAHHESRRHVHNRPALPSWLTNMDERRHVPPRPVQLNKNLKLSKESTN